jgi:prolyl oligopeptidase
MQNKILNFLLIFISGVSFSQIQYPVTPKTDQIDDYNGTKIYDPYRWLEDDTSEARKEWVEAENKVTTDYLNKIPYRQQWRKRIETVFNYAKYSAPFRNGKYFYFYKNDGLQNQPVLFRQKGLYGKSELIIDPNQLSEDGTTLLKNFVLSKNGKYAAYGLSKKGSDWISIYVREMAANKDLDDEISWVKVSEIAWHGNGFYYSRYPAPENGMHLSFKNENHQVWYHTAGTKQSEDKLIFEDKTNPERFHFVSTSENERYVYLTIYDRGKGFDGNALYYLDSKKRNKEFKPIIPNVSEYFYNIVQHIEGKFLILTNDGAPNGKLVLINPARPGKKYWKEVIPEKTFPIENVNSAGGKLFVTCLKDVVSKVYVYKETGQFLKEVNLPSPGTVSGFTGKREDKFAFYTFNSFTSPPAVYRYDIATGRNPVFRLPDISFNSAGFETKQVFYESRDGTKVPMFLVYKKQLKLDGTNPALLSGYGGFNISILPAFSPSLIPWLEQGGIFALANLRGGAEYGEKWHEEGMRLKKQNVFDDFISAAEYLIQQNYTCPERLAIWGRSNGGLLVGAVMNQRPELFKVAIPEVGVMDMLRFQKFTIGWNWIAEFGSSDSTKDFKNLYAYSPLHNIKEGKQYPATLITTADHDDRVVPAHSFKYAATLQEKYKGTNPILIRIETQSGHASSNTAKNIEQTADIYSFIFYNMGLTPQFPYYVTKSHGAK